ncbi:ABC-2 type transport system ATP-binding protein [Pseudobutyrivibrio sp. OR37]|uniref:ATP-binding cassette domain-containing protein n=1 Tax=Pseudobutyrivibrio sp. OR37 TaxID=1798186 RepID=UPI0008E1079E|nr:ATP-binding cassette domain-containing protein [Pseudobutyrivibrio sp. OR37]SFH67008.1 ABC-2 type transport system ATP-binding protein [Pseudobutyrivibrio sp. OR37]
MEYVFKANGISKKYGKYTALSDVNMEIPKGAIYGFVGKNGAGKTTLIRIMCGLQKPSSGFYELLGKTADDPDISKARRRVGAVVEAPAIYKDMTARDNLIQQCLMLGLPDFGNVDELLSLVGLADTGKKKARNFSLGMRQRLGIAVALCGNPDFIILDEPINGLDPQGIIEIRELILKLNRERGITFLISSHILDELSKIATNYGFIDNGHIVRQMSSNELKNECRKSVRMKVSDVGLLTKIMEEKGIEYKVISNNTADVYSELNFSTIAKDCDNVGCTIITMEEHDESLEAFYLSLLGGKEDVQKSVC